MESRLNRAAYLLLLLLFAAPAIHADPPAFDPARCNAEFKELVGEPKPPVARVLPIERRAMGANPIVFEINPGFDIDPAMLHRGMPARALAEAPKAPAVAPNSPEAKQALLFDIATGDAVTSAARVKLVEESEILLVGKGGMGVTFAARDPKTQRVRRYKAPRRATPERRAAVLEMFQREAQIAHEAGEAGIAPKAEMDPATGLLVMDEVEGMDFLEFQAKVLPTMTERERDAWLSNFIVTLGSHVEKLHELGIAHLDLKPSNVMIPKDHGGGKNVLLIDFGLALRISELGERHAKLSGKPYAGTPAYQGKNAAKGLPCPADDFHSMQIFLSELFPRGARDPYLKDRPQLRALFALFSEPPSVDTESPVDYRKLLALAVEKRPSDADRAEFWRLFQTHFDLASPGQRLKILFSDSGPGGPSALLDSFEPEALKTLMDDGMKENGWKYGGAHGVVETSNLAGDPLAMILRQIQPNREIQIDFQSLKAAREKLGPVPGDLVAPSAPPALSLGNLYEPSQLGIRQNRLEALFPELAKVLKPEKAPVAEQAPLPRKDSKVQEIMDAFWKVAAGRKGPPPPAPAPVEPASSSSKGESPKDKPAPRREGRLLPRALHRLFVP